MFLCCFSLPSLSYWSLAPGAVREAQWQTMRCDLCLVSCRGSLLSSLNLNCLSVGQNFWSFMFVLFNCTKVVSAKIVFNLTSLSTTVFICLDQLWNHSNCQYGRINQDMAAGYKQHTIQALFIYAVIVNINIGSVHTTRSPWCYPYYKQYLVYCFKRHLLPIRFILKNSLSRSLRNFNIQERRGDSCFFFVELIWDCCIYSWSFEYFIWTEDDIVIGDISCKPKWSFILLM